MRHGSSPMSSDFSVAKFKMLQEAKEVLCDDAKRRAYDTWRNSHVTVPWKTWNSMTERSQPVGIHYSCSSRMHSNTRSNGSQESISLPWIVERVYGRRTNIILSAFLMISFFICRLRRRTSEASSLRSF